MVKIKKKVATCSCKIESFSKTNSWPIESKNKKKKVGVLINRLVSFMKRIARLPLKDRKEILKVLKKQECKKSVLSKASKVMATNLSTSSHTSNSSVNKD